jgi:hypothetical protein
MTAWKLSEFGLMHPPEGNLPRRLLGFLRHRERLAARTGLGRDPYVYRKPKPGRSGDEARQGLGVN